MLERENTAEGVQDGNPDGKSGHHILVSRCLGAKLAASSSFSSYPRPYLLLHLRAESCSSIPQELSDDLKTPLSIADSEITSTPILPDQEHLCTIHHYPPLHKLNNDGLFL